MVFVYSGTAGCGLFARHAADHTTEAEREKKGLITMCCQGFRRQRGARIRAPGGEDASMEPRTGLPKVPATRWRNGKPGCSKSSERC